jgi:hypothetical protein
LEALVALLAQQEAWAALLVALVEAQEELAVLVVAA